MKNIYRISLMALAVIANNAHTEQPKLLHEVIDEKIEQILGISTISTRGNLDLAMLCGKEDAKNFDPQASMLGNAFITYKDHNDKIGYGAEVGFKTRSGIVKAGRAIVDTAHIDLQHDYFGTFKFGYTESVAFVFNSSSRDILVGYKSFECSDKGLEYFYQMPTDAILNGAPRFDNKAAKIWWMSPTYKGITIGLSYAPNDRFQNPFKVKRVKDESNFGSKCSYVSSLDYFKNFTTGAISYEHGNLQKFHYCAAFEYWYGKAASYVKNRHIRDVHIYNIGLDLGYNKFKTSFNYTDNGKSGLATEYIAENTAVYDSSANYSVSDNTVGICNGADAGKVYRAVMGYDFGKIKLSAGYLYSKQKLSSSNNINSRIISAGIEYKFDRAMSTYFEYDHIRTRMCDQGMIYEKAVYKKDRKNNNANMYIFGMKINI